MTFQTTPCRAPSRFLGVQKDVFAPQCFRMWVQLHPLHPLFRRPEASQLGTAADSKSVTGPPLHPHRPAAASAPPAASRQINWGQRLTASQQLILLQDQSENTLGC